jgi:DNA segregation ATPase FtsK/SpoIIIE-like protein
MSMLIATAALDPTARLWLLDGKLVELAAWAPCAERMVGPDVGEAIELLEQVREEMERRYRQLLAGGLRKIAAGAGMPLHVVACDELAFYLTCEDRKQRTRFAELLRDLVARSRAAGVIVLAATQKPSADVVPSALRDLFGFRLAGRCTTPQGSDTILGQGGRAGDTARELSHRLTGVSATCWRRTGCRSSSAPSTSTTSRSLSWPRELTSIGTDPRQPASPPRMSGCKDDRRPRRRSGGVGGSAGAGGCPAR